MKIKKRFLSLALALVMILGSLVSATPVLAAEIAGFTDVKEGDWFFDYVNKAAEKNL